MSMGVALESREFLSSCLKAALDDADLVDAISDQALEQGFSALTIGQGKVSVDQLKDKLYLTVEEAKSVLNICTSMVAGTIPSKPSNPEPVALRIQTTQSGGLAMRVSYKQQQLDAQPAPAPEPVQDMQEPEVPFEPLEMIMENAAVVVVSRATPYSSEKKILAASEPEPLPSPMSVVQPVPSLAPIEPATTPTPEAEADNDMDVETIAPKPAVVKQTIPKPVTVKPANATPATTPSKPDVPKQAAIPTLPKPVAIPASPKPAAAASPKPASPRPASAAASTPSKMKTPEPLSPEASAFSPRLTTSLSSPASASPSYLRPTAAHKARISKDAESVSPNLAPVPEDPLEQRKRRNLFSRMASTLLAPTQAFVARVTGRGEETKSKKDMPMTKMSLQLESMLSSPQGQRVTKPQPFMLRSEMRGKSTVMSTEELEMAEARDKAFKRNPVPKHVYESRPIAPVQRSAPKDPNEVFEPFQLASVELHNKKMEERRRKMEEEAAREEEARRFKARSFDARIAASPATPPKPPPSPVTKAAAPVFASEARIQHYHEVIEPAKKAKEAEINKEKLEAERKAKELEEMDVEEFRKTLEFKARPMPNFSSPFRVDPSLSRPVTSPSEPKLHTTQRLGTSAVRADKEGPGLGNGVYDGAGYVDPFFASLRKSTSVNVARLSTGSKSGTPSSMKRGNSLRASASASLHRHNAGSPAGGVSVRGSVGSNLQAAIRAAARDAARDLAASGCLVSQLAEADEETIVPTEVVTAAN